MSHAAPPLRSFDLLWSFSMSRLSIICAAIAVWFSTAAVDGANAKGTFRLEGHWRIPSAHSKAIEHSERRLHRSDHAPRGNHQH
jgi:hypothetical protein